VSSVAQRHAEEKVTDRHAEKQRGDDTGKGEQAVPGCAPARIVRLVAKVERDRAHDQREQDQQDGEIKTRK